MEERGNMNSSTKKFFPKKKKKKKIYKRLIEIKTNRKGWVIVECFLWVTE